MTDFVAALVRERGVRFVVISVRDSMISSSLAADQMIGAMSLRFQCPAVLMGATSHATRGRRDLAEFVAKIGPRRLPWRRWSAAA